MENKIVIVGAGPAGVSVVKTLRTYDRRSQVTLLSAEPYPPYSPPAMADHFINGSGAHLWLDPDWSEQMGVDYHARVKVTALEPDTRQVRLEDGGALAYDKLVIASGSRLYAPLEGADLPGVHNFKSLSAAEALVRRIKGGQARTAVIVGAGFIGMEIALLLRELGVEVTQVEMLDQVMPAMLDSHSAEFALQAMRQRGVQVRLNTKAIAFIGNREARGVQLENGETLDANILIAATGVRPNLEFLESSGIDHNWGISVDDHLRTSLAGVYAAGDVIETPDRLTGQIYVHAIFPNAVEQGRVVGLNLAGIDTAYQGAERMNSLKHLGLPLMAVGMKDGDEVLRECVNGTWRTLYLQDDRLVGYQLIGDVRPSGALRALLNRGDALGRLKQRLLEPTFGQGTLTWNALGS